MPIENPAQKGPSVAEIVGAFVYEVPLGPWSAARRRCCCGVDHHSIIIERRCRCIHGPSTLPRHAASTTRAARALVSARLVIGTIIAGCAPWRLSAMTACSSRHHGSSTEPCTGRLMLSTRHRDVSTVLRSSSNTCRRRVNKRDV